MTTEPTEPTTPPSDPAAPSPDPAQLRDQLARAEARLAETRRRYNLENALREAGAIDVEAAAILIERSTAFQGGTSDTASHADASIDNDGARTALKGGTTDAIADLKARRPYLFRAAAQPAPSAGSAMSPAVATTTNTAIHRAAEEARAGDPNAVLRYMRLRREAD